LENIKALSNYQQLMKNFSETKVQTL